MPPCTIHAAHEFMNVSISTHIYHLLRFASFPVISSQQIVLSKGRAYQLREVGIFPHSGYSRAQFVKMPIAPAINNVFGSGSPERITDQGKAISRSSPDGLPHDILETPGTILVPDQFVDMAIRIHCAGIRYLLRLAIRPARACQYGIF